MRHKDHFIDVDFDIFETHHLPIHQQLNIHLPCADSEKNNLLDIVILRNHSLSMKKLIILGVLLAVSAQAREKHQLRQWTGESGKKVIAKYKSFQNGRVNLQTIKGNKVSVSLKTISNDDKIYLRRITRDPKITFDHPTLTSEHRKLIPTLNQSEFGNTNNNCGPNAISNFLLWWDQNGVMPLPYKEKELDKLADDLHSDLERTMRSKNGTSASEMKEGLKKYFERKKLHAYYSFEFDQIEATMENLESSTSGDKIAVLSLKTLDNGRLDEGHYVSLVSVKGDIIEFNTWGMNLKGKLREGVIDKQKGYFIEVVANPGNRIFTWLTEDGGGFFIEESDKITTLGVTKRDKPKKVNTGFKTAKR